MISKFIYILVQKHNIWRQSSIQMYSSKKRGHLDPYSIPTRGCSWHRNVDKKTALITCVCGDSDELQKVCFRCSAHIHYCVYNQNNRGKQYECASCINMYLDPQHLVRKVFVESHFKMENIFDYQTIMSIQFTVNSEDFGFPVEVRGLKAGGTILTWPMQGQFYVNNGTEMLFEMRPLRSNSSRKTRRQEYFVIPRQMIKLGKNFLRYKIPALIRETYAQKFQHDVKGSVYYFSINSVVNLDRKQVINQTFMKRRTQKEQSLQLLTKDFGQFQVTKSKLCLVCPYTKEKIKYPVRGKYCKHFTCICLQTLIITHQNSRYWGCPVCQAKMNEPYVDIWIYDILKDNTKGDEVIVNKDGSYEWTNKEPKAINLSDQSEIIADRRSQMVAQSPVSQAERESVENEVVIVSGINENVLVEDQSPEQRQVNLTSFEPRAEQQSELEFNQIQYLPEDSVQQCLPQQINEPLMQVGESNSLNKCQRIEFSQEQVGKLSDQGVKTEEEWFNFYQRRADQQKFKGLRKNILGTIKTHMTVKETVNDKGHLDPIGAYQAQETKKKIIEPLAYDIESCKVRYMKYLVGNHDKKNRQAEKFIKEHLGLRSTFEQIFSKLQL